MADIALTHMTNIDASRAPSKTLQAGLRSTLATWVRRSRARRELTRFAARDLRDIGITASEAAREAAKPFWQA